MCIWSQFLKLFKKPKEVVHEYQKMHNFTNNRGIKTIRKLRAHTYQNGRHEDTVSNISRMWSNGKPGAQRAVQTLLKQSGLKERSPCTQTHSAPPSWTQTPQPYTRTHRHGLHSHRSQTWKHLEAITGGCRNEPCTLLGRNIPQQWSTLCLKGVKL